MLFKEGYTIQAIAALYVVMLMLNVECAPIFLKLAAVVDMGSSVDKYECMGKRANYVQRLLREAGIDGDYKMASTQAKLIHYGMFHGQWIGVVSPTDAKEFIKGTNVDQLTIAFLKF